MSIATTPCKVQTLIIGLRSTNTEFADDATVPALVTGVPFTDQAAAYRTNVVTATGQARNRPLLTIRNNTAATKVVKFCVFIGQQG